jgi:hypothetical protein
MAGSVDTSQLLTSTLCSPIVVGVPLVIAGHNRQWIDGSIPMVSIDTFGLIFIDVIDPSVKDFFIFDRQSIIKAFSDRWSSIHRYTLNRLYRSINKNYSLKKSHQILAFFSIATKNAKLLLKNCGKKCKNL